MSADTSGEHARLMVFTTGAVELREFNASDGHVLDEVFAGLSAESRFLRYLTAMPALPDQARSVLTSVDGIAPTSLSLAVADGKAIGIGRLIGLRRASRRARVSRSSTRGRDAASAPGSRSGSAIAPLRWAHTELVAETSARQRRASSAHSARSSRLTRRARPPTGNRAGDRILPPCDDSSVAASPIHQT